ncbi:AraC-type DNA-binding protein [Dokdonia pacifica]|uniref:AraC-type DNA-binding protein n=1 Tax=Dokdonia pacifica TaxID=1627892 RepID=A0A239A1L0_9FLAO|nr:AraC-type DNA-binding protein [Dokdonia pacifica]
MYSPSRYKIYLTSIHILIIFFLPIQHKVFAQLQDIPKDIRQETNDQLKSNILELSQEEAVIYEKELLRRLESNSDRVALYEELSRAFSKQGDNKRSIRYVKEAILYAQFIKDKEKLIELYRLLGNSELFAWHDQEALDAYYKALEIAQKQGNIDQKVIFLNPNIAIIRRRMRQLDKALEACNEALAIIPNTIYNNERDHVNLLTIVSEVHLDIQQSETRLDLQQYDTVLKYVNQGLSMSNELDYKAGLIDLYTKKGTVYFYKKDYTAALQYLKTADRILKESEIKHKSFVININYFLASCYVENKEYKNAIDKLQQIIDLKEEEDKNHTRLINTYKLMATSYEGLGESKNSLYWYNKYSTLNEKYQKGKDKVVNTIYEKDTGILGQEIAVQKRNAIYFLCLLIAVSGICILIIYIYKKKQRASKQSFNKLLKKVNQLEMSSKESPKSKEKSREVIIDDEKVRAVLKGLKRLEDQEFFLNTDCSLRSMAKKVKTNATYLSKIINTHKGLSYNDYINNLRIDYAVNRIKSDKKFRSFSIKSIATELGYKSDYSFAKHFKSKTGINPSYYIKRIENI